MGKNRAPSSWLKSAADDCSASSAAGESKNGTLKRGKSRPKTMAELADKHQLYHQAVQKPRKEVKNLDTIYRTLSARYLDHLAKPGHKARNRPAQRRSRATSDDRCSQDDGSSSVFGGHRRHALSMREDFCGTAVLCAEWVRTSPSPERRAYGVDIDKSVIDYAHENTLGQSHHGASISARTRLICADVMDVRGVDNEEVEEEDGLVLPKVDIIASLNYAMCYFHQRRDLVRYLRHSLRNLNDFGLLFCDIFGGVEATRSGISNIRDLGTFKYYFNQHSYDLARNTVRFSLGFKMSDGSVLRNCFSYEFRVYSICELKEAMLEAGFDDVSVWINSRKEDTADDDSGRGSDNENTGALAENGCSKSSSDVEEGSDQDDGDSEDEDGGIRSSQGDFVAFTELTSRIEMPYAFNAYVVGVKLPCHDADA
ncbi:hypothetical protein GQ54DRAFT_77896 [Martensiomyces pterosporus]|nr:hypothetical protein GQ54DRAFT_77896 [Martensiomyces pterosporus]